jgi:hypothetical protein
LGNDFIHSVIEAGYFIRIVKINGNHPFRLISETSYHKAITDLHKY